MHIRTIYFKVTDLDPARAFWMRFLGTSPHKDFEGWCEFMVGDVRLALLPLDNVPIGSGCVPVFELPDRTTLRERVDQALGLGAKPFLDAPDDVSSVVLLDPAGNQFELTDFHE